uniref:Uncharacterized protein n=1 Tax=viral metagenome TaxID=1070528 RepID=A0A6C0J8F3_9ZZZZ
MNTRNEHIKECVSIRLRRTLFKGKSEFKGVGDE